VLVAQLTQGYLRRWPLRRLCSIFGRKRAPYICVETRYLI